MLVNRKGIKKDLLTLEKSLFLTNYEVYALGFWSFVVKI